jgi:acetyl CoA:N6-hydroxylysine acetyl transferase
MSGAAMTTQPEAGRGDAFRCFTAGGSGELRVAREERSVAVLHSDREVARLAVARDGGALHLRLASNGPHGEGETVRAVMAALEALFADDPGVTYAALDRPAWTELADMLTRRGIALGSEDGLRVLPEMFWQLPDLWMPRREIHAFPQHYVMSGGKRHPRRAPKPGGVVYSRYIPWLRQVFSFRTVDIETDLARFNRWMNDPRVAHFWNEEGDLEKHRAYLSGLAADPHMLTLLGCLDGAPFCYFEVYWAKENRLAPYYDADDYDRGWHVVVGEDGYRGRDYVATWLPCLMHYMLLDDPRTQRIVGEPRADHTQQIRNLERSGFASVKEFDFPHKRAMLVMLLRERYFGERLWIPRHHEAHARRAETDSMATASNPSRSSPTPVMRGGIA